MNKCSCCSFNTTKDEMIKRHGTIDEFVKAMWKACDDLFITDEECVVGIHEYAKALSDAPTTTPSNE